MKAKRWTLSEIRQANLEAGRFWFSRDTLRHFGETMQSFGVRNINGRVFIVRVKPQRDRDGKNMGGVGKWYEFDPATGEVGLALTPEEIATVQGLDTSDSADYRRHVEWSNEKSKTPLSFEAWKKENPEDS